MTRVYFGDFKKNQMGFWPFDPYYTSMTDYQVGYDYMKRFFNSSYNVNKKTNVDQYIIDLRKKLGTTIADNQVASLGLGIRYDEMSEGDVQDAADELARLASGRVPATISEFRQALVDLATNTKWVDSILSNSVVTGTAAIGDAIIDTTKNVVELGKETIDAVTESATFTAKLLKYMPFILPVAIGVVAWQFYDTKATVKKLIK